jgi:hypothetical protein
MQEQLNMESFIRFGLEAVAKHVKSHFSKARIGIPTRDGDDSDYYDD